MERRADGANVSGLGHVENDDTCQSLWQRSSQIPSSEANFDYDAAAFSPF
jgi:hypothetical protein